MSNNEHLLSTAEILKILDIPYYRLDYLFRARKLRPEDFLKLNGKRIYKYSDLGKIREALFEVTATWKLMNY